MLSQKDRQNYFAQRIINRAKIKDGVVTLVVSKKELIDPMLKACFKDKFFQSQFDGQKIKFLCDDSDLFFKEEEFLSLVENYQAMEESKGKLSFKERVYRGIRREFDNEELVEFSEAINTVERSFEDVLKINKKLYEIAETINSGYVDDEGNVKMLSPFEKYFLCYQIVNDVEYFVEDRNDYQNVGHSISRSLIDVINNQKGCCAGKAEYLYALLSMVGIDSCPVYINSYREHILYEQTEYDKKLSEYNQMLENYISDERWSSDNDWSSNKSLEISAMRKNLVKAERDLAEMKKKINNIWDSIIVDHATNLINLKDEKYSINGIFMGDATDINKLDILPIPENFDFIFNFVSLFTSMDRVSAFLDKIEKREVNNQTNNEVKDYIAISRRLIIDQFKKQIAGKKGLNDFEVHSSSFIQKLEEGENYDQVLKLIDEYCSDVDDKTGEPNKFAPVYREIFEKILYDENERFIKIVSVKDLYSKMKKANFVNDVQIDSYLEAKKVSDKAFKQLFEGSEYAAAHDLINHNVYFEYLPPYFRDNKRLVRIAVKEDYHNLEFASERLKGDGGIVFIALSQDLSAFDYASERLKNDPDYMLSVIDDISYKAFEYASERLKNDPDFIADAVEKDYKVLDIIYPDLYEMKYNSFNIGLVLSCIKQAYLPTFFPYLPKKFKNDHSIVLETVKIRGSMLENVPVKFRNDKEIVIAAIKQDCGVFDIISEELKNDKDVVLALVKEGWYLLKNLSEKLRNDKDVILAAISESGYALEFASKELQNDREIVLTAIKKNYEAFEFASDELKNDRDIVLGLVKQNWNALEFASEELKNDKEIVMAAVAGCGHALEYASDKLKNDKDVVLAAIMRNGDALLFASEEMKDNFEIVMAAVEKNVSNFKYSSEKMKDNMEAALYVVLKDSYAINFLSNRLQNLEFFKYGYYRETFLVKTLDKLAKDLENFSKLPLEFFKEENSPVLDVAMELVKLKLSQLPQTEESKEYRNKIRLMMKKTVEENAAKLLKSNDKEKTSQTDLSENEETDKDY